MWENIHVLFYPYSLFLINSCHEHAVSGQNISLKLYSGKWRRVDNKPLLPYLVDLLWYKYGGKRSLMQFFVVEFCELWPLLWFMTRKGKTWPQLRSWDIILQRFFVADKTCWMHFPDWVGLAASKYLLTLVIISDPLFSQLIIGWAGWDGVRSNLA